MSHLGCAYITCTLSFLYDHCHRSWSVNICFFCVKLFGLVWRLCKLFGGICGINKLLCYSRDGTYILALFIRWWKLLGFSFSIWKQMWAEFFFSWRVCDSFFTLGNWASVCIVLGDCGAGGRLLFICLQFHFHIRISLWLSETKDILRFDLIYLQIQQRANFT